MNIAAATAPPHMLMNENKRCSNWRGKPLVCHQTIVKLISSTTTAQGLSVQCSLDENEYEKGRKVSDDEMGALKLYPAEFWGKWK